MKTIQFVSCNWQITITSQFQPSLVLVLRITAPSFQESKHFKNGYSTSSYVLTRVWLLKESNNESPKTPTIIKARWPTTFWTPCLIINKRSEPFKCLRILTFWTILILNNWANGKKISTNESLLSWTTIPLPPRPGWWRKTWRWESSRWHHPM